MNIFVFETRSQLKNFVVWAVSLLALFLVFTAAFYGPFMNSKDAVQKTLGNLPPAFSAVFGVQIDAIFSFGGYFQFIYTYVGLVGAIMASAIGLTSFAREKRSKCVDFLFAKPISRHGIFMSKLLSCLLLIVMTNILFIAASMLVYSSNNQDSSQMSTLILAASSLFFTQLVFLSIGILYAVFAKKVRAVSGTATALGFAGFILMALVSLIKEDILRFVSPLNYFSPGVVFTTGSFETKYAVTAAVVFVACLVLSSIRFVGSDTPSL